MMIWIWVIGLTLVLMLLVIWITLKLRLYITCEVFYKCPNALTYQLKLYIFNINIYKKEGNMESEEDFWTLLDKHSPKEMAQKIDEFKNYIHDYQKILLFLHHLSIHELTWSTTIGMKEASSTGVFSGLLWTVKGVMLGKISELSHFIAKPVLNVIPHYQSFKLDTNIHCMASIRVGQAIKAILFLK